MRTFGSISDEVSASNGHNFAAVDFISTLSGKFSTSTKSRHTRTCNVCTSSTQAYVIQPNLEMTSQESKVQALIGHAEWEFGDIKLVDHQVIPNSPKKLGTKTMKAVMDESVEKTEARSRSRSKSKTGHSNKDSRSRKEKHAFDSTSDKRKDSPQNVVRKDSGNVMSCKKDKTSETKKKKESNWSSDGETMITQSKSMDQFISHHPFDFSNSRDVSIAPSTSEVGANKSIDGLEIVMHDHNKEQTSNPEQVSDPQSGFPTTKNDIIGLTSTKIASDSYADALIYNLRSLVKHLLHFRVLKIIQVLCAIYIFVMTLKSGLMDPETGVVIDQQSVERTEEGVVLVNGTERAIVGETRFESVLVLIARLSAWFMYPSKFKDTFCHQVIGFPFVQFTYPSLE